MGVLPARAGDAQGAIAVDAMSDPLDPRQRLRVEVDELARSLPLVAVHDRLGFQHGEPRQTCAPQYRMNGGRSHPEPLGDLPAGTPSSPKLDDAPDPGRRGPVRQPMRCGTPILEAFLPPLAKRCRHL